MHGKRNPSTGRKLVMAGLHLASLVFAGWILFGGGDVATLGRFGFGGVEADTGRKWVLLVAGSVYWVRMAISLFAFLSRGVEWLEVGVVSVWLFAIHATFALLGASNADPIGWLLLLGVVLYVIGSSIHTASEWQRYEWKRVPAHAGRLHTGGLFRFARHINYFGDLVLFSGYALMTGRWVALGVPALMLLGFVMEHSPKLDKYLATRYGEEYARWAERTPRLIPWIY